MDDLNNHLPAEEVEDWINKGDSQRIVQGNAKDVLEQFPDESIDMVITSPPYWGVRSYNGGDELGLEENPEDYIDNLLEIFAEIKRVLKEGGSFWLNMGDKYDDKDLKGMPWRTAIALQDRQNWVLRNDIIWNKVKGNPSSANDRLRVMHEYLFHFTKQKDYYYDLDAIRPEEDFDLTYKETGEVVSPTGVSGTRYREQISESDVLSEEEKENARKELERHLQMLSDREIKDFRMVIRDEQRSTHGDSEELSGRARELAEKGFYFLTYNPKGPAPGNIWDILPEDRHRDDGHCAVYPARLCEIPIQATCPPEGIVLDPMVGTGSTLVAAKKLRRRGIGIDVNKEFLKTADKRLNQPIQTLL